MSRIGRKPVFLPEGVTVAINGGEVSVKGAKAELTRTFPETVTVSEVTDDNGHYLSVEAVEGEGAIWGTVRSHLANMVQGVSEGWKKVLELNGVGFKMNLQGKKLVLSLGFSHDINYELPEGVEATIEGNKLTIAGSDKETVGQVASEIRAFKKPEPYKGKGFKYDDEIIRRKAGKAAKSE
jgi:large subunit ribosomal protein L6